MNEKDKVETEPADTEVEPEPTTKLTEMGETEFRGGEPRDTSSRPDKVDRR